MSPSDPGNDWESLIGPDGNIIEPDALEAEVPADVRDQIAAVEQTREAQAEEAEEAGAAAAELSDVEHAVREIFGIVDWPALFGTDFSKVEWLPGRFMERGQQVALVGEGKAGKSLFALEWAWRSVSGRRFLGDEPHPPLTVLYVDKENSPRDLMSRLQALGAPIEELSRLRYAQFPRFNGSLDGDQSTKTAAQQFLRLVEHYEADVVIIDTVSRFISGKENDSDTWLSLYSNLHEKLKARGVACLRLDHFGKDDTKGSRGSSAKSQDVDHVWELSKLSEKIADPEDGVEAITTALKLHRTHTRTGLGRGTFPVTRVGEKLVDGGWVHGSTSHTVADPRDAAARLVDENDLIVSKADELLRAGFTGPCSRRNIQSFAGSRGIKLLKSDLLGQLTERLKFHLREVD